MNVYGLVVLCFVFRAKYWHLYITIQYLSISDKKTSIGSLNIGCMKYWIWNQNFLKSMEEKGTIYKSRFSFHYTWIFFAS